VISEPHKGSHFFFTVPIFSLASWIGPMFMHEKKPGDAIALLAVEMGLRDGWLSPDVRKEMSHVARRLLQQCLRPDTDVLLPNMGSVSERDLFFAVIYTQKQGAEVISKRIQEQFRRCEELQPAGLTLAVSHRFLAPISIVGTKSMETFVEQVSTGIQNYINAIKLQRSI
jgi:hypothetical protein